MSKHVFILRNHSGHHGEMAQGTRLEEAGCGKPGGCASALAPVGIT